MTGVTYRSLFIGDYQSLSNIVIVLPIDSDNYLALNSGLFSVPPAQLQAFAHTRTGALVRSALARRMHWKIGDQVPIHALNAPKKDGSLDWTFDIVGIFDIPGNPASDESLLLMNYPYLDTARPVQRWI